MGQKNQGIFSIEKEFAINRDEFELTMTLMRLITIQYFNRLTALIKIINKTVHGQRCKV